MQQQTWIEIGYSHPELLNIHKFKNDIGTLEWEGQIHSNRFPKLPESFKTLSEKHNHYFVTPNVSIVGNLLANPEKNISPVCVSMSQQAVSDKESITTIQKRETLDTLTTYLFQGKKTDNQNIEILSINNPSIDPSVLFSHYSWDYTPDILFLRVYDNDINFLNQKIERTCRLLYAEDYNLELSIYGNPDTEKWTGCNVPKVNCCDLTFAYNREVRTEKQYHNIYDALSNLSNDKQHIYWHEYGKIYEMIFDSVMFKTKQPLKVLEIGVSWRTNRSVKVFEACTAIDTFVGVDVLHYPQRLSEKSTFYLRDAYSTETIEYLVKRHGTFDLIIDDGSHTNKDQKFFLENYDMLLSDFGKLVCEDVSDPAFFRQMCKAGCYGFDGWANARDTFEQSYDERLLIKDKKKL